MATAGTMRSPKVRGDGMLYAIQSTDDYVSPHAFDTEAQQDLFLSADPYYNHEADAGEFMEVAMAYGGFTLHRIGCAAKFVRF